MPVHMELRRIIINELGDQQIIVLKEVEGERSFPMVIGPYEAASIDRRVRGLTTPRPMTHDLVVSVIDHLGGEIQDVLINDLIDGTYYARLRIHKDGELVEVDCRPSDAIAVAITVGVPIYVNESVLREALEESDEI
ncbi:MAG: bifunctional nuclease family protein [Gemmataceae bacterium]|nr:bifunctional nuclease family protein [Gemmataceae bacterium]MCS7271551.1 bifunctional nuclease family protein [Gemmataceae bacterium]MDW8243059.1 bifunctional nuclease family protein [Thermogemmata sp.]